MKTINLKFGGKIYIEELTEEREEFDRIKIFDSNKNYLDYWYMETITLCAEEDNVTEQEIYDKWILEVEKYDDIYILLNTLHVDYFLVTEDVEKLAQQLEYDEKHEGKDYLQKLLQNEYCAVIGKYYVGLDF